VTRTATVPHPEVCRGLLRDAHELGEIYRRERNVALKERDDARGERDEAFRHRDQAQREVAGLKAEIDALRMRLGRPLIPETRA
jgi:hypothetical protein